MTNTNTAKMTKKDKFSAIANLLNSMDFAEVIAEGFNIEDAIAFLDHEVELLNKKKVSATGEKKLTDKQKANLAIGEDVVEMLANSGERMTITQIIKETPNLPEDMTNQRMTHIVSALVEAKRVERIIDKRVSYFRIAD